MAAAPDAAAIQAAMRQVDARRLRAGAGMLFAYGALLLGCAAQAHTSVAADAREQAVLDGVVGACARAGGIVLFVFAAIKGYVPGNGKRRLQRRSQAYLPRVLLACMGAALLYRSHVAYADAPRGADGAAYPFDAAAAGVLFFLGLLGWLLAGTAAFAAARADAAAVADRPAVHQAAAMEAKFRASRAKAKAEKFL